MNNKAEKQAKKMASKMGKKEVKRESWMRDKDYAGYVKRATHEPSRERLEKKTGKKYGVTERGLYAHNPKTGFNELVHKRTGKFTGKSPY